MLRLTMCALHASYEGNLQNHCAARGCADFLCIALFSLQITGRAHTQVCMYKCVSIFKLLCATIGKSISVIAPMPCQSGVLTIAKTKEICFTMTQAGNTYDSSSRRAKAKIYTKNFRAKLLWVSLRGRLRGSLKKA